MKTEKVHISNVVKGDTLLINGKEMTVGSTDIRNDPFYGMSVFGDCHRHTKGIVERILFPKWYMGQIVGYVSQI